MTVKTNINQIKGRIISEPILKEILEGKKLLTFRFMYSTLQKTDSQGSHANFIQVETWGKSAEFIHEKLRKGLQVLLNGSFVQKRYISKEGKNISLFIFCADHITITDMHYNQTEKEEATPSKKEVQEEVKTPVVA